MNICFNGEFISSDQPVITSQNASFKCGDGVFETLKVFNEKILLQQYHFDRLFLSLKMLEIEQGASFSQEKISQHILELCRQNNCANLARVRLAVFRNRHNKAEYLIEAMPLSIEHNQWNEIGWHIDLYPHARKQTDAFANIKSASFLPYVMAGRYAREKNLDEAIVLNTSNKVCDGSKTNVFLISKKQIITPALHQGCINGVMRRHLITELKMAGWQIKQEEIAHEDLLDADEIFLTNAIHGLRWVQAFRDRTYASEQSFNIYSGFISTLYR